MLRLLIAFLDQLFLLEELWIVSPWSLLYFGLSIFIPVGALLSERILTQSPIL